MATMNYLYTGELCETPSSADAFFALLQNGSYLLCDWLVADCSDLLIKKLKRTTSAPT